MTASFDVLMTAALLQDSDHFFIINLGEMPVELPDRLECNNLHLSAAEVHFQRIDSATSNAVK